MKKLIAGIFLIMGITLVTSCATAGAKEDSSKPAAVKTLGIPEALYQTYVDKSFVSSGNNYRVKKLLEKLRSGEKVYIAALGGSVTEGAGPKDATGKELWQLGYAFQFNDMLKAEYTPNNGANVVFDGAGLSGTPSSLGLIRYESDVVEVLGHTPDLLIIEFSVNDDGKPLNTRGFEQLIRQAYLANEETAVIALYSAATYGNQMGNMKPIADYYGVPQVNLLTLVNTAISAGLFAKEDYYSDYVHPTKEGHQLQAECLMNLVSVIDNEEAKEAMSVPAVSYSKNALDNFKRILADDENVKINVGSFKSTDNATQSIKKTGKGNFPKNWHHASGSESFTMDINCKAFVLVYKVQGSWLPQKFGKAEVYVDGKLVDTYDGGAAGGWCNCEPRIIIDESEAKQHKVEVKMTNGDESKGFTIVAMGYNK